MATVLFATMGTHGDVAPMLAVASELRRRGHRPLMLANPGNRPAIEAVGIPARWVGASLDVGSILLRHPEYMGLRGGELVVRDFFARLAPDFHRATRELIASERPAAVVAHLGLFGTAWAARQAGVPLALVHLAPLTWLDVGDLAHYGRILGPLLGRLLLPIAGRRFAALLAPAARACAVAPRRDHFAHAMHDGDLVLGLWSSAFRPARAADPPKHVVCGTAWPIEAHAALPAEVEAFLAAGPPPLALGLGTSAVHVAGDLYERTIAACARLGLRCILACGERTIAADPRQVLALPRIQFHALFRRCAVVMHHGGIGSTMAALRSGRPQIVLPFAHDQFDNAARIRQLGAGRGLWQARATPARLARLIATTMERDAARAAELGVATMAEEDGAVRAARAIEGLFANGVSTAGPPAPAHPASAGR